MSFLEPSSKDVEPSTDRHHGSPRQAEFVWVDRGLMPLERANAHLLSPAIHYGPGIVSSMRSYGTPGGPAIFGLRHHAVRFLEAVRSLGMGEPPFDRAFLRDVVWRVVLANDFYECYIRCGLYLESPLGLRLQAYRPILVVTAWEFPSEIQRQTMAGGVRLTVSAFKQPSTVTVSGPAALSVQATDRRLAQAVAQRTGFDDALLLDENELVIGCTDQRLLLVRDDTLHVAPLAGQPRTVAEQAALSLARAAGCDVIEEQLPLEALFEADEVMVCGTRAEIAPVREVDGQSVGGVELGPVTARLQTLFRQTVHGATEASSHWLDYMDRSRPPLY